MTQIENQAWERVRERGLGRLILRVVLLRHCVPFAVYFGLYLIIYYRFLTSSHRPLGSNILGWALATVIYGTLMGVYCWNRHERDYQKPVKQDHG